MEQFFQSNLEEFNSLNELSEEELQKLKLKELENFYKKILDTSESTTPTSIVNKELNNQIANVYSQVDKKFGNPTRKLTLTELQQDPEFAERAERFMLSLGKDENIIEYLRDSDFSLSSAAVRSSQSGKWDKQTQEDYKYLRQAFDNAEVSGFREHFGLLKDFGIDLVRDPLHWLAAMFVVPSGGFSAATTGAVAARTANAAQQGLKQLAKETAKQGAPYARIGAVEGATFSGLHDLLNQEIDLDTGAIDSINIGQIGLSTGLGLAAGATLGGAVGAAPGLIGAVRGTNAINKEFKHASDINDPPVHPKLEEEVINNQKADEIVQLELPFIETAEVLDALPRDKTGKIIFSEEAYDRLVGIKSAGNKVAAFITGKATSEFVDLVDKNTPELATFLRKLRYDYDQGLYREGVEQATKVELADGTMSQFTFGEYLGRTTAKYLHSINKINNPLGLTGWYSKLNKKDEEALLFLLRDNNITATRKNKKYGTKAQPTDDLTFKFASADELEFKDFGRTFRELEDGNFEITTTIFDGKNYIDKKITFNKKVLDNYKQTRVLLNEAFKEGKEAGLFKFGTRLSRGFLPRHYNYAALDKDPEGMEKLLIKYKHAEPKNTKDPKTKTKIEVLDEEGNVVRVQEGFPEGTEAIDMVVYGTDFLKDANGNMDLARKLKAQRIVNDMLEKRNNPFIDETTGSNFLEARVFQNIPDNELSKYLDDSVFNSLQTYFTNFAQFKARRKYFGKNFEETLKEIKTELAATKKYSSTETKKIIENLETLHDRTTGVEQYKNNFFRTSKFGRNFRDTVLVTQQASLLPLATLSSITEPLILLSRAPLTDSPEIVKDIGNALYKQTKKSFNEIYRNIQKTRNIVREKQGKELLEIKSSKDLADDEWLELYETGLALDQAVLERIEGLTGEGLESTTAKNLQKLFFELNFLAPWTKAVQLASFKTGKRLIQRNSQELATGQSVLGKKLNARQIRQKKKELKELGINDVEAVNWYKSSLDKDGNLDKHLKKGMDRSGNIDNEVTANFWTRDILGGANRFTKEIILNPRAAEANRPTWFGHPAAQFLVQFAGYPTVFNNTILTRFIRELNPTSQEYLETAPRTLGTIALMTSVAYVGNEIRSRGQATVDYKTGEQKPTGQILGEAVRRWGGFGPLDYASRYRSNAEQNTGAVASALKSVSGPAPQDIVDAILYRKGFAEALSTELPFYGSYDLIFGPGTKKELRRVARQFDGKTAKVKKPDFRIRKYAKGGIVDVPKASREPDERVNKLTGEPYNSTSEAAQDVEDRALKGQMEGLGLREAFVLGGFVSAVAKQLAKKGLQVSNKINANENEVLDIYNRIYNFTQSEYKKWFNKLPKAKQEKILKLEKNYKVKFDYEGTGKVQNKLKSSEVIGSGLTRGAEADKVFPHVLEFYKDNPEIIKLDQINLNVAAPLHQKYHLRMFEG